MTKKYYKTKEFINNGNYGTLYVVGTPIGNLQDITLRAIETLKIVDIILAEDTRQTLKLLNHFNISKHLVSYHKHNELEKLSRVVALLESGKNVALVSDAGMPLISDPGESLIHHLVTNNYKVETIPGVTALTTAIVQSGIDGTRFVFEGFLPINKKDRKKRLENLSTEIRTIIIYEAPHKLSRTLNDLLEYLGDRKICISRELTKIHEEYIYSSLSQYVKELEIKPIKGEIVLIIEGKSEQVIEAERLSILNEKSNIELVKKYIETGMDKKLAIKEVAKLKKISKNEVYKECLDLDMEM